MWYVVISVTCVSCALTYLRHLSQYLQKTFFHKCLPPHNISTSKMQSHVPEKKNGSYLIVLKEQRKALMSTTVQ